MSKQRFFLLIDGSKKVLKVSVYFTECEEQLKINMTIRQQKITNQFYETCTFVHANKS